MVYTDNPYVDIIVYNVKEMALGTVLKMEEAALLNETLESKRNADKMIACVDGTATWNYVKGNISVTALNAAGIIDPVTIAACLNNPDEVPADKKDAVFTNIKLEIIAGYTEMNTYYRNLNGLPALGYEDVYISYVPPEISEFIDTSVPVHEMSYDQLLMLNKYGALEVMYNEDPKNRSYLFHVLNPIDPFTARKASRFAILYIPEIDSTEIYNEYKDRLVINRTFALQTVYSEAYKYESDYYDNFIAILIVISAMCDVISRTNEFITRQEVFDLRTVRYIFESHGVTYFPEIPMKYQLKMVKNLHTLIKFKSTQKCMIDICSLFGFDNITIFKYYLLRSRNYDRGKDQYSFTGDNTVDFDMKFIKIPLDKPMDEYIRNRTYHCDYDEITEGDPTWDGGLVHEDVKDDHLEAKYNYTRTKYLSVDSIYDIAKVSIQQAYFFNMLYDNVLLEKNINLTIPYISPTEKFNIADIFEFLTCISYRYYGMDDLLFDTQSKILTVYGFDFNANLAEIATHLQQIGSKPEVLEALEQFIKPVDQIPTMKQLMNIFVNNLNVRNLLVLGMKNADNLKIYNSYKYLFDSLMIMELTMDFYKNPDTGDFWRDEDGNATHTEFLKHRNLLLYYKLVEIDLIDDPETKADKIATLIDNIIYVLEEYIDTKEFSGLFYNLPVVSIEAVKKYIMTVIDFYKSYKVHFLGINTIYIFDDKYEGWVKIIDWVLLNRWFEKDEIIPVIEKFFKMSVDMTPKDQYEILEMVYMDIKTWAYKNPVDHARAKDILKQLLGKLRLFDVFSPVDNHRFESRRDEEEMYTPVDFGCVNKSTLVLGETYKFIDKTAKFVATKQYYFSLDMENSVIPADPGYLDVYDDNITELCVGQFVPNASVYDLFLGATVDCDNGVARISLAEGTQYDMLGTINIVGPI